MKNILVEEHRGFCAKYPENTLLSYERAIELGVDAIEFDVWLSKDGVPVLMHDGNAYRTCGVDRDLRDMTLSEIKELNPCFEKAFGDEFRDTGLTVPTLRELLELCKAKNPSLRLGIEIKEYTEKTVDFAVAMLKEYGFFDDCWFYAFNGRIIKYIKTAYGGRTMGYPDFQMQEFEADTYDYYDEIGLSGNIVRSEIADVFIKKGLPIHMYCADDEKTVKLFIDKGADLITANDPTALLEYLGRK